ncbi:hypothetical protein ACSQ67_024416 [Phaseolus vulgaris]
MAITASSSFSCCCLVLAFALSSFRSCISAHIGLGSKLLSSKAQTWVSENGTFALGFTPADTDHGLFELGVWFAQLPGDPTLVWSPNRDTPVSQDAILELDTSGNLVLMDGDITVWTSNTSGAGVQAAVMAESGNFILHNATSHPVWQSFSQPSDTLLPNQLLTVSSELTSSKSSSHGGGYYSLKMLQQRTSLSLALTYNLLETYQASDESYTNYSYWEGPDISNVTGEVIAVLDHAGSFGIVYGDSSDGAVYVYKNDGDDAGLSSAVNQSASSTVLRRLTLEKNGNLRLYRWDEVNGSRQWMPQWAAVSNPCDIAGVCGNGVCNLDRSKTKATCTCLPGTSKVGMDGQCYENSSLVGKCNDKHENLTSQFRISTVQQTNYYFSDISVIANYSDTNVSKCGDACLSECDCVASVYGLNEERPYCWVLRSLSFGGFEDTSSTLFVKIRANGSWTPEGQEGGSNSSSSDGMGSAKEKAVIIPTVLSMVVLIVFLSLLLYYSVHRKRTLKREMESSLILSGAPMNFTYRDLQIRTCNFSQLLGTGGFGSVYKGSLGDGTLVAVKKLDKVLPHGEKEFITEVNTIGSMHHMNLVRLCGYCSEGSHSYGMLLLEIIGGRRNLDMSFGPEDFFYPGWAYKEISNGCVSKVADRRLNGAVDEEELTRALKIAFWCIQDEISMRPTMGEVVRLLEDSIDINMPPMPQTVLELIEEGLDHATMEKMRHAEELVREFLVFRGFTNTLESYETELRTDIGKGFEVNKILDLIFSVYVPKFHADKLVALLGFFKHYLSSPSDTLLVSTLSKLEASILRFYVVHAVQCNRNDKVVEFFALYGSELLQRSQDWTLWFAIPYKKNPHLDPEFRAFFSKEWYQALHLSSRNFFSEVFSATHILHINSVSSEMNATNILKRDIVHLNLKLSQLQALLDEKEAQLRQFRSMEGSIGSSSNLREESTRTVKNSLDVFPTSISQVGQIEVSQDLAVGELGNVHSELIGSTSGDDDSASLSNDCLRNGGADNASLKENDGDEDFAEVKVEHQETFLGHTSPISRCRFSASGNNIASASLDGTVRIWTYDTSTPVSRNATIYCGTEILSLDWECKSDRLLLIGTSDGCIKAWNVDAKRVVCDLSTTESFPSVLDIKCSPVEPIFVSAAASGGAGSKYVGNLGFASLTVWNMKTWKAMTVLPLGEDPPAITSLCFNHNGKILAASAVDGMIHMFGILNFIHLILSLLWSW